MEAYFRLCEVPDFYRKAAEEALAAAKRELEVGTLVYLRFFEPETDIHAGLLANLEAFKAGGKVRDMPMFSVEFVHGERGNLQGLCITRLRDWTPADLPEIRIVAGLTRRELTTVVSHEVRHLAAHLHGETVGEDRTSLEGWQTSEARAREYETEKRRAYERLHPPVVIKPPPTLPPELMRRPARLLRR